VQKLLVPVMSNDMRNTVAGSIRRTRMEGKISLKNFILGVKNELQDAAAEGSKNPFLELTHVELEAEFDLDATASAEGSFGFFVKASGETSASQAHRVKLIFSPISANNAMMFAVSPSDTTDKANPIGGFSPSRPIESFIIHDKG
jgi:hypothetical protein